MTLIESIRARLAAAVNRPWRRDDSDPGTPARIGQFDLDVNGELALVMSNHAEKFTALYDAGKKLQARFEANKLPLAADRRKFVAALKALEVAE